VSESVSGWGSGRARGLVRAKGSEKVRGLVSKKE
jgi:hypothetical protein